ncbi:hypothetical protein CAUPRSCDRAFT_11569 [Caulochytrium protostelioides]|uniref:Uncharacterized protein n=1 Tax=Caulochytrium protostelioides TaxID=1555241 RepID=A0A4P9WX04_9FUNG|nr:hypothetical protein CAUPRSCDRAFT_11569 [Caulochytrium protostelioides]
MTRLAWALCHIWLLILAVAVCVPLPTVLARSFPRINPTDDLSQMISKSLKAYFLGAQKQYDAWDFKHRVLELDPCDLFEFPWSDRLTQQVFLQMIQTLYDLRHSKQLEVRLLLNRYKLHRDNLALARLNNDVSRMQQLHHYQAAMFLSQLPTPTWFKMRGKIDGRRVPHWQGFPGKFTFLNDPQHPEAVEIILKYLRVPEQDMSKYLSKGEHATPDEESSTAKAFENLFSEYMLPSFVPDNKLLMHIQNEANLYIEEVHREASAMLVKRLKAGRIGLPPVFQQIVRYPVPQRPFALKDIIGPNKSVELGDVFIRAFFLLLTADEDFPLELPAEDFLDPQVTARALLTSGMDEPTGSGENKPQFPPQTLDNLATQLIHTVTHERDSRLELQKWMQTVNRGQPGILQDLFEGSGYESDTSHDRRQPPGKLRRTRSSGELNLSKLGLLGDPVPVPDEALCPESREVAAVASAGLATDPCRLVGLCDDRRPVGEYTITPRAMVAALLPIVATDADDEAVEVRFMSAGDVDLLLLLPLSPGAVPRAVDRHASGMSRLLLQASTTVGAGEAVAIVDTGDASAAVVVAVVSEAEMAKTAGEAEPRSGQPANSWVLVHHASVSWQCHASDPPPIQADWLDSTGPTG